MSGRRVGVRGWTELHEAARLNDTSSLRAGLAGGLKIDAAEDYSGYTPLRIAAGYGNSESLAVLIEAGADIEISDASGRRPLHWASSDGDTRCIELLLGAGADVNAVDSYGGTPLFMAAYHGHPRAVNLLLAAGGELNPSEGGNLIAEAVDSACLATLLRHGIYPWYPGRRRSFLQDVMIYNDDDRDGILPLLAPSLDPSSIDGPDGSTFLHDLVLAGHVPSLRAAVTAAALAGGADPNIRNGLGETPLMLAAGVGGVEMVEVLLGVPGIDVGAVDICGRSAMDRAEAGRRGIYPGWEEAEDDEADAVAAPLEAYTNGEDEWEDHLAHGSRASRQERYGVILALLTSHGGAI